MLQFYGVVEQVGFELWFKLTIKHRLWELDVRMLLALIDHGAVCTVD